VFKLFPVCELIFANELKIAPFVLYRDAMQNIPLHLVETVE